MEFLPYWQLVGNLWRRPMWCHVGEQRDGRRSELTEIVVMAAAFHLSCFSSTLVGSCRFPFRAMVLITSQSCASRFSAWSFTGLGRLQVCFKSSQLTPTIICFSVYTSPKSNFESRIRWNFPGHSDWQRYLGKNVLWFLILNIEYESLDMMQLPPKKDMM
jgi:hypothetical protein